MTPVSEGGQQRNKDHANSLVVEAICSQDLWFWHVFVGPPGSNNDIGVLARSPLMHAIITGALPEMSYSLNGHQYTHGYWLADGIYPAYRS